MPQQRCNCSVTSDTNKGEVVSRRCVTYDVRVTEHAAFGYASVTLLRHNCAHWVIAVNRKDMAWSIGKIRFQRARRVKWLYRWRQSTAIMLLHWVFYVPCVARWKTDTPIPISLSLFRTPLPELPQPRNLSKSFRVAADPSTESRLPSLHSRSRNICRNPISPGDPQTIVK